MSVDISGIHKVKLLRELWNEANINGFILQIHEATGIYPSFNEEEAKEAVTRNIDYFCGKPIKCNISKNKVNPWLYDRETRSGKFQEIVNSLKK